MVSNATLSASSETVHFQVVVDGRLVRCIASREFFEEHFGATADPASWMSVLQQHRVQIETLVAERYRRIGMAPVLLHDEAL
jgi:Protein of unknown function (DUF1488)